MVKLLRLMVAVGVLALAVVGGWWLRSWVNPDGTVSVTITQAMIDEVLARKFPKEKTYAVLVKVTELTRLLLKDVEIKRDRVVATLGL